MAWREKLVKMDVSSGEAAANHNRPKDKKRSGPKTNRGSGNSGNSGNLRPGPAPYVPQEQIDKRKAENRCLKCGRTEHMLRECRSPSYRLTPPPRASDSPQGTRPPAPQAVQSYKKQKTDQGQLQITELQSEAEESDSGKE
ncbi:hypothetical protein BGX38DRAFT_1274604 [Terfezia claveryi]|nr:hypothetical protein BGX38DRAFT_1274604 [Terfezia claveryi]